MIRKLKGVVLIFFLILSPLYSKFHPEIKWKEIRHGNFIVIFPDKYEESALFVSKKAEDIYDKLKTFWGWKIRGKIRIVLSDVFDSYKINSTFFPYNQIEISIFPPEPESVIGNWHNWLEDAVQFELNSLFILNSGSGAIYGLRKYLGFNTMFFPAGYIPGWIFNGIQAQNVISSGLNRMIDKNYIDLWMQIFIKKEGKFPMLNSLKGKFLKWPGELSNYFFGVYFVGYMEKIFGIESMKKFVRNFPNHPFPFIIGDSLLPVPLSLKKRFKMTFNEEIERVVSEIENDIDKSQLQKNKNIKLLTNTGDVKRFPTILPDGKIVYFKKDLMSPSSLILLNPDTGKKRILLANVDITGISYSKSENKIYFSAIDHFRSFYRYSDVYMIDPDTLYVKRFTRGKRVSYPVSDGNTLYCIQRRGAKSLIVELNIHNKNIRDISGYYDLLSGLSISPEGKRISVAAKTEKSGWKILIIDLKKSESFLIRNKSIKDFSPKWLNNNELLFISHYDSFSMISEYKISENRIIGYSGGIVDRIRYFDAVSTRKIVGSIINADGFELEKIDLKNLKERVCTAYPEKIEKAVLGLKDIVKKISAYNPFRDFLPQYFTLAFRMGGNEIQTGLVFSGFDSIKKHYFKVKILRGFLSKSWNTYLNYLYDENYGTFSFKYTNYTDMNSDEFRKKYFKNREKLRFSFLYPIIKTNRGMLLFYSDLHFENESESPSEDFKTFKDHYYGFRAGISFDSTSRYYDSISPSDGMKLTFSYSRELKFLGSENNINTASLEFRQFIPIFRPNLLALRFVITDSWGEGQKRFYMGGVHSNNEVEYAGENHFDLTRGFPAGYFAGNGGYLVNAEYRIHLKKIGSSFLILKSLERIYFSFFADTGKIWDKFNSGKMSISLGGEFNLIAYIGRKRFIASAGVGFGINSKYNPLFYLRIGNSF